MADEFLEVLPRPGSDLKANFAAAASALLDGLGLALDQAVLANGGQLGPWFDELEAEAVRHAKGASGTGLSMGYEADAIQFGADVVRAAFAAYRSRHAKSSR